MARERQGEPTSSESEVQDVGLSWAIGAIALELGAAALVFISMFAGRDTHTRQAPPLLVPPQFTDFQRHILMTPTPSLYIEIDVEDFHRTG